MNSKTTTETETIRSDIEMTRQRMDDTMDALGERMRGRHLLDEIIGLFRKSEGTETGARVRQKLSETANTATHAVVDTVKNNPLPILLITAGAAWLAYSARRGRSVDVQVEGFEGSYPYDPDTHYDRPLSYPGGTTALSDEETGSKFGQMKDKASEAKEQVKQKLSDLTDRTREKLHSARERASDMGTRVRSRAGEVGGQMQERTREMYDRTRERVVQTSEQHPLEVGAGVFAIGLLLGLALPTPEPIDRVAGPTMDRLKSRTREASREALEKGKRVVQAATEAARDEAKTQGLTPEQLKASATRVGEEAEAAGVAAARKEGFAGTGDQNRSDTGGSEPSAVRPV